MATETGLSRRALLQNASAYAAFLMSGNSTAFAAHGPDMQGLYLAARREASGEFSAALFSMEQGILGSVRLPGRGHGFAVQPGGDQAVCFARRPGRFGVAFNPKATDQPPVWFKANANRHFYGHGVFSADGHLLYSTENDFDQALGVIGVRDARKGYTQIGEFNSFGTGPHEIAMLSDGKTLVIANGGIETHPDLPRKKLNLSTMKPSLVYLDAATGDLIEQHHMPRALHKLSIRHMTVAKNDTVVFGCQHQGPKSERPPLVGFHNRGEELKLVQGPKKAHLGLQNYVGSVACDHPGAIVATTSPRGNRVQFWDVTSRAFLGEKPLKDVCGAAPLRHQASGFVLTTGGGLLTTLNVSRLEKPGSRQSRNQHGSAWDNHAAFLD